MGHKFPLYILYLSIAKKFLAVHEPSPLDLEEAPNLPLEEAPDLPS